MAKILVTSALPYVNNIPHLGNLIGAVLSADVYARHKRLQGHEVLYVCGADEHGSATEKKAQEEQLTPQELCDKYGKKHKEIYDWFNIKFDAWGRTHTQAQEEIVHEIFHKLDENGYIFEEEVEQLYDKQAQAFLADRFVEGDCHHCGAQGARGDQCDACGQLIQATKLQNPVSKLTGTTPIIKQTTHLFLDLPALKPLVEQWLSEKPELSANAKKMTRDWLKKLEPRAITRDLSWGVPVPKEGFEDKVFYVWFDAPIGYISITAQHKSNWAKWWLDPDVELAQFMAKDNILFHSIFFPATLLGTGDAYTLLDSLNATEYLNLEAGKFSKSRQQGVFGDDVIRIEDEHGIVADAWRYTLLANRPETSDTVFSWDDLQSRVNNELIANLANLAHRTTHFAYTHLQDADAAPTARQEAFIQEAQKHANKIQELQDQRKIRAALSELMKLCTKANKYFQHAEPWKQIKEDRALAAADVQALLTVVKDISILAHPFIPETSKQIQEQLNLKNQDYSDLAGLVELDVQEPHILFEKISEETLQELKKTYEAKETPLDLRVAKIVSVREHPNADRLYLAQIDLGDEQRQLVAGLKNHYEPDELVDKQVVVIANLQPATIRGEKSQGMLLASENKKGVVGLLLAPQATPGDQLRVGRTTSCAKSVSFEEFTQLTLASTPQAITVDGQEITGAALKVDKEAYGTIR